MTLRIVILVALLYTAVYIVFTIAGISLEPFLALLGVLAAGIYGGFQHYRHIGLLRARGKYEAALKHLKPWRLLFPLEAYEQVRLPILVDSGDLFRARDAIEDARKRGLGQAFVGSFLCDLYWNHGRIEEARAAVDQAISSTPPGKLLAGLMVQLARLIAHEAPKEQDDALALLDDAYEVFKGGPEERIHTAVRGELLAAAGDYEEAVEVLRPTAAELGVRGSVLDRALAAEIHVSLAMALWAADEKEEARGALKLAASLTHPRFLLTGRRPRRNWPPAADVEIEIGALVAQPGSGAGL